MLSLGFNWAQLDIGFRDHWLSPATDSSMLVSTESPTTLSATLSNYEPLTRLGFQYELFLTRLSQTGSNQGDSLPGNNISYNGVSSRGNPRVFGTQLSIEPFSGLVARRQPHPGVRRRQRTALFGTFSIAGLLQAERTVADAGQSSRLRTSAGSFFRGRLRLPSISSTPAKIIPTAAATCSAMPRSRPGSIFRASGTTST